MPKPDTKTNTTKQTEDMAKVNALLDINTVIRKFDPKTFGYGVNVLDPVGNSMSDMIE